MPSVGVVKGALLIADGDFVTNMLPQLPWREKGEVDYMPWMDPNISAYFTGQ